MGDMIFKIWYMIVILPLIIFIEANTLFANFLKKRNIYATWTLLHSVLALLIIAFIILWVSWYGAS